MSRPQARRRRIASLDTVFFEGSSDGPYVVLFHGFGADMNDLAPLAAAMQVPKGTNWVFPNGHLSVPLGGHYEGRAWFPISIADIEKSMTVGEAIDFSKIIPPGLKRARGLALDLIEELGVPSERIVLGGFSQGAMLATDVTLHMAEEGKKLAGLALLSGTLVNADEWAALAPFLKGFRFFQSHGTRDPVLSFAMARELEKLLLQAGWSGKLQAFDGAHEIPSEVLIQMGQFIRERLS